MTDTECALLADVIARPDDDLPRLTFADWLEENAGGVPCPLCEGDPSRVPWCGHGAACMKCNNSGRVPDGRAGRAEFIRCQITLARFPNAFCRYATRGQCREDGSPCPCQACTLRRREREIVEKHGREWIAELLGRCKISGAE